MAAHELLSNPHCGAAKGGEEEKRGREGKRKGRIVRHLDGRKKKKTKKAACWEQEKQTDKHPTEPKSHLSPHIPRSRGVGKGCPPKSPSLLHREGLSREPKGSQHPGAQREAAWDHCWPLRWRKPAQALDATEISTPLSSCPLPALGCPVCPLSSPVSLTIPSPPPFAAILGTHCSSSLLLLLLPSSALPLRAKAFFPAQSQDRVSSTSLHLSPNPNPLQRGSAPYLTLSDAQRNKESGKSEIFHIFLSFNNSAHICKKGQKHLQQDISTLHGWLS